MKSNSNVTAGDDQSKSNSSSCPQRKKQRTKEEKLEANRRSAAHSRNRKRLLMTKLQDELYKLRHEMTLLQLENKGLRQKLSVFEGNGYSKTERPINKSIQLPIVLPRVSPSSSITTLQDVKNNYETIISSQSSQVSAYNDQLRKSILLGLQLRVSELSLSFPFSIVIHNIGIGSQIYSILNIFLRTMRTCFKII